VQEGGYSYSARVQEFLQTLKENGFIQPFNWTAWEATAQRFLNDSRSLSEADLRTLIMLFTTLVKKEAVNEGHLMLVMCSGQLSTILQRLQAIYRQKWGSGVGEPDPV
jgi:hypothetical protein